MKIFNSFRAYQTDIKDLMENESDIALRDMVRVLQTSGDQTEAADVLHEVLIKQRAADPSIAEWSKWGFSAPSFFEDSLALAFDGCVFLFAEKRERLLPGDVLRRAIAEEVDQLQSKQEEPVNKKQFAELKDVVVARLLPKSHIKSRMIPIMFTIVDNQLLTFVFTSSAKLAEDCLHLLRRVNDTLPALPFGVEFLHPLDSFLTDLLRHPNDYTSFSPARNAVLYEKELGVVSYKDADLEIDENDTLRENLENHFTCTKLQMRYHVDTDEYALVTLNSKGSFSGFKMNGLLEDRARNEDTVGDQRTMFQAYAFLMSRTLTGMLWSIRRAQALGEKEARESGQIIDFPQGDVRKDFPIVEDNAGEAEDDEDCEL